MLNFLSPDPIALHARLRPDAMAAMDLSLERRWTYRELDTDIQRAISALTARDVKEGDRVATLARNSVHQVILQQALMRIGAIFVPLNWRLSSVELGRLVLDCAPRLLIADQELPPLPPDCTAETMASFAAAVDGAQP
ncbi:AMP-binding protein, partial [Roseomonas sp. DSM 102946]|nr:AMP-binding protein [Roseomonas sp. DSM 102946]